MLTEKSFDTGELTINYAEGENNGAPLVLLHGLSSRWQSTWNTFLPSLVPDWHVFAPDLRGHGKSGRAGEDYSLTDYARDIAAFLGEIVSEPAVLMGHSLGAVTAFATAALVPEHIRALVLLDPPLFTRNLGVNSAPGVKTWFGWVYETMKSNPTYEEVLTSCRKFIPEASEAEIQAVADQIIGVAPETVTYALQNRLFEAYDIEDALHRITCPVLLLYGGWDVGAAMRDEDAAFFAEHCPKVIVSKFPHIGHLLDQDKETVLPQVKQFLSSL
jgi:pimeloyl-ACP methyl ester carboxylesterase